MSNTIDCFQQCAENSTLKPLSLSTQFKARASHLALLSLTYSSYKATIIYYPEYLSTCYWEKYSDLSFQNMEARGLEPLTSGLQSPRSAKLSYAPSPRLSPNWEQLMGLSRFELLTSRLSGVRSNQLSYRPSIHFRRKIKPLGLRVKWLYRSANLLVATLLATLLPKSFINTSILQSTDL